MLLYTFWFVQVALTKNKIVGTLDLNRDYSPPDEVQGKSSIGPTSTLYINNVAVDSSFRRQGIATWLMNGAINMAKAQGASSIFTRVYADNDAACKLYYNAGFLHAMVLGALDPKASLGECA